MQVGAFMHVVDDDAAAVSKLAGLKLQLAGDVEDPVKIGGFPKSGLDSYIGRPVRAGHSVSVAMQGFDHADHSIRGGKNEKFETGI